jgi:phosphoglucosamine mutase
VERILAFGTDGLRGNAQKYPFTQKSLLHFGQALALWNKKKHSSPHVLIAYDTRESCERIKQNLIVGLLSKGTTYADAGVLPTPAVLSTIQHDENFTYGIMISASHNPYYDNGIKVFDSQTGKLSCDDEQIITQLYKECEQELNSIVLQKTEQSSKHEAYEFYKKNILSYFSPSFLNDKKIVLDCAQGATHSIAPEIFSELGGNVITLSATPNGRNINEKCGTLFPEHIKKAVLENNADIGFAFDGDGDRVIAITKDGHIRDGDDILALLLNNPSFSSTTTVVGTVMTNHGFECSLKEIGKSLVRTPVGDKYVLAHLQKHNLVLGGETSGHIIQRHYLNTGDGIFTALKALETLYIMNDWSFKSFEKLPQTIVNVPIKKKDDLNKQPYFGLIEKCKKKIINGRMIVRFSGTENVLRVMIEEKNANHAHDLAHQLAQNLQEILIV